MPKFVRYGLYILLALLAVSLFLGGGYQIELTNGYKLTRLNRHYVTVTETRLGDYPVLSGNVEAYAVAWPFITGYASTSHLPATTNIQGGYFVVNTDSHRVMQGLSNEKWKAEMDRILWAGVRFEKVP